MHTYYIQNKIQYKSSTILMRLQFQLKKVKVSPSSHIQINRHAQQQRGKYAAGQLYGALYDDEAHITNILPYQDTQNYEDLDAAERRHEDLLNKYGMDPSNIGWYIVSYKQNFWEQLENIQLIEKINNTSFFLVYNYQSRLIGKNPYKAYRLTDQFALKENLSLKQFLAEAHLDSPFTQISVQVQKNQLFQILILFNKKNLIKQLIQKTNKVIDGKNVFKNKIQSYTQSLKQQSINNYNTLQKRNKQTNTLSLNQYAHNIGLELKVLNQEKQAREYQRNINLIKQIVQNR